LLLRVPIIVSFRPPPPSLLLSSPCTREPFNLYRHLFSEAMTRTLDLDAWLEEKKATAESDLYPLFKPIVMGKLHPEW